LWQELRPLWLSVPLFALLLSWGAARLERLPPAVGEPVTLAARLPASSIGAAAHLVPQGDIEVEDGWVRLIEGEEYEASPRGLASWTFRALSPGPRALRVRFGDRTLEHPIEVGGPAYAAPLIGHGSDTQTIVRLRIYRPFGIPGALWLGLPPWLVWLSLLTLACYLSAKRLLRVA
jgi:hypothetical protein